MRELEMKILIFLEGIRNGFWDKLLEAVTIVGEETVLVVLIVTLWFAFDKKFAQKLLFITMASLSVNTVIKNLTTVPRPFASGEVSCIRPDTATGYAFPSGHTQNFTTWSVVVAQKLKKIWFTVIIAILIPLVAFSRVYIGAHYPSDVIVGVTLGVLFGIVGGAIYDKFENKLKLYSGMTLLLMPFAIMFMFFNDPLLGDFYKFYGMIGGMIFAVGFEEKHAPLSYDSVWWKKIIRIVIGIAAALAIKEGIKLLNVWDIAQVTFLIDTLRYFLLVCVVMGLCPLLFKKLKI